MASQRTAGDHFRNYQDDRAAKSQDTVYTTSNGVPMPHPYETQRVGENGPLLLQDFHLIDLLSHFDRERIPERVVHAKDSGARGVFKATKGLENLCLADMFTKGKECPVTVRFSTVGGESGSHDCARDPRGFSVKSKTDEGNWDLVANNTPVFFLRDPAKFPHFIHTQKRDPSTHLTHADDSTAFWDYLSQNPESVHQVMVGLFSYQFAELFEKSWEPESCFRNPGSYMPAPETAPRLLCSLQIVDFLLC
jgi:catalase